MKPWYLPIFLSSLTRKLWRPKRSKWYNNPTTRPQSPAVIERDPAARSSCIPKIYTNILSDISIPSTENVCKGGTSSAKPTKLANNKGYGPVAEAFCSASKERRCNALPTAVMKRTYAPYFEDPICRSMILRLYKSKEERKISPGERRTTKRAREAAFPGCRLSEARVARWESTLDEITIHSKILVTEAPPVSMNEKHLVWVELTKRQESQIQHIYAD